METSNPIEGITLSWISVKDKLPEKRQEVLFYIEEIGGMHQILTGHINFGIFYNSDGKALPQNFVTNWMPLPRPPINDMQK